MARRLNFAPGGGFGRPAPFKGVEGGEVDAFASRLAPRYCNYRKASIYAGSNEIQRNIIAKATLGL